MRLPVYYLEVYHLIFKKFNFIFGDRPYYFSLIIFYIMKVLFYRFVSDFIFLILFFAPLKNPSIYFEGILLIFISDYSAIKSSFFRNVIVMTIPPQMHIPAKITQSMTIVIIFQFDSEYPMISTFMAQELATV